MVCDCSRRSATRRAGGHRHALLGAVARFIAAGRGTGRQRVGPPAGGHRHGAARPAASRLRPGAQHVALGHAAVLPVPATEPAARLLSAISLAAAGMATPQAGRRRRRGGGGQSSGRRGAAGRRRRCHRGLAVVDRGDEPGPLTTVPPSPTTISASTPARRRGRRHFEHHLVGLDLDQDLRRSPRRRRLLLPLQQVWLRPRIRTVKGTLTSNDCHFSSFQRTGVRPRGIPWAVGIPRRSRAALRS